MQTRTALLEPETTDRRRETLRQDRRAASSIIRTSKNSSDRVKLPPPAVNQEIIQIKSSDELREERLIRACRNGDAEACAALVKKYAALIYSVPLHNFGMSQDDAEDIYQICYMKVLNRAKQFRGQARFSAWLRTVVRNICVDCIRAQKPTVSLDQVREGCENCPLSCVCNVDALVNKGEDRSILERAIVKLPDHYRKPIQMFFLEDKSYKEISEILDKPVNTVGTHINRGLARLRKHLSEDPDSEVALQLK